MPEQREIDEGETEQNKAEVLSTLQDEYSKLLQENDFLAQENRMFENYMSRVYPNMNIDLAASSEPKKKGRGRKGRPESSKDSFYPLSAEEKSNICSHEIDAVLAELARVDEEGQEEISEVKTLLQEVDNRIAETKKDTHDFKREIIVAAENPRTGKTISEKFVKYMEDRLRSKDILIEKLKLKNQALKSQRETMKHRAQQKEEMSDMLHVVDFDQLKIENQQYLERIEEKNAELLQVKVTTGRTVQALNNIKQELNQLVAEHEVLAKEKQDREAQKAAFQSDFDAATGERDKCKKLVRRLQLEQKDTDQPQILDYIKLKHEVMELDAKKADLTRKCDIAEMDATRTTRILKSMGHMATSVSPVPNT